MQVGTETGSMANALMAGSTQAVPVEFMAATVLSWTDRHAGTIVEVGLRHFVVQADKATLQPGETVFSDSQRYFYTRDPKGPRYTFKRVVRGRQAGQWRENGRTGGCGVLIGRREHYRDPSF